MFFQFAAWASAQPMTTQPTAAMITTLHRLHPRSILAALEQYFTTRAPPPGPPDYAIPLANLQPVGNANLANGIANNAAQRWDHVVYAYLVENSRIYEIFDRIIREYEAGERFETPDTDTALWLRTTEALFYRDLPSDFIGTLTSAIRPDLRATRRNTYYRLLGFDLNHGLEGNRAYPFERPSAANREFVATFEALLREVWRGATNSQNATGPNETDDAAIADYARRLQEMLVVRRQNGNLLREEFWAVATLSWFHLAIAADSPVVRALKAEADSPADRLRKLGERVGIPAHGRSDDYFNMAFEMSAVLRLIETGGVTTAAAAPGFYRTGGPFPQLPTDMRTIITHWSGATGRDIKGTRVTPPPPPAVRPGLPERRPRLPDRQPVVAVQVQPRNGETYGS